MCRRLTIERATIEGAPSRAIWLSSQTDDVRWRPFWSFDELDSYMRRHPSIAHHASGDARLSRLSAGGRLVQSDLFSEFLAHFPLPAGAGRGRGEWPAALSAGRRSARDNP
jgi:hypothetical protein